MSGPERVLVLGFGPVAARLVDGLLPAVAADRIELAVVGAERRPAYNRVLVADVGVGRTGASALGLADPVGLRDRGVAVLTGTAAVRVDRAARRVLLDDGTWRGYDRLVFATGARPVVPTLRGLDFEPHREPNLPDGVVALRTLDDAALLLPVVRTGGRVVVLGGGILGVEAAVAAAEEGASAVLVHHGPHPLARSLDTDGGRLLAARLEAAGVRVVGGARAVGIDRRSGRFAALEVEGGPPVPGDLLVLSCGVRPRDELASGCGLPTGPGIRVDRGLQADTEGRVFAVGDCAAVDGAAPSGLIGPGWAQADALARRLSSTDPPAPPRASASGPAASPARSRPRPAPATAGGPLILLKARGLDLAAAGDVSGGIWDQAPARTAVWADPAQGRYCRMTTVDGVLTGFVAIGMPRAAAELVLLYERGAELPADRSTLLRLDDPAGGRPVAAPSPGDVLCRCSGATHGDVADAVAAGCADVDAVGRACRAGTGCGGCRERIEALLVAAAPAPAA